MKLHTVVIFGEPKFSDICHFRIIYGKKEEEQVVLDHKKAMNLWEQTYGKETEARDYRNRSIRKEAYGQQNSKFGWDVHHKVPTSRGGTDAYENLQIVHVITHDEIHGR
jgi:hypothetical protein